jgi:hypothetical protein
MVSKKSKTMKRTIKYQSTISYSEMMKNKKKKVGEEGVK